MLCLLQLFGRGTHWQHPASSDSKRAAINNSAQTETSSQTCTGWQAANDTMVKRGTPTAIKHNRQQTPPSIFWTHRLTLAINHSDHTENTTFAELARCRSAPRAALNANCLVNGVTYLQFACICPELSACSQTYKAVGVLTPSRALMDPKANGKVRCHRGVRSRAKTGPLSRLRHQLKKSAKWV